MIIYYHISSLYYIMLCYAMLCYVMLCHVIKKKKKKRWKESMKGGNNFNCVVSIKLQSYQPFRRYHWRRIIPRLRVSEK